MSQADKLLYFNGRARAEPIRMLYALAGEKLTDDRFDYFKEWKQRKPGKSLVLSVIVSTSSD